MKKFNLTFLVMFGFCVLLHAQNTQEYDTPPEFIGELPIVVTPEDGIRPASYTDLDLTQSLFRLADFLGRQNQVDVINKTGLVEFFDIDFSSSYIQHAEELSTDLEEQLGLVLVPVQEMDWVLIVE